MAYSNKRNNLQNFNDKWNKILYFYQITYLSQIVRLHVAIGDRQLHPPDQSRIPISAPVMWSQFPRQFDSPEFAFEPMTSGWLH